MHQNGIGEHGSRVLVIGAGFAGLAAARTLLSKGKGNFKVTILEGANRVGGRAHSVELPNSGKVEMGATWFHGIVGNPLYDLAEKHGFMNVPRRKDAGWGSPKFVRENQFQALTEDQEAVAYCGIKTYGQVIDSLEGVNLSVELSMTQDINQELMDSLAIQDYGDSIKASPGVSVGQLLRQKLNYMLAQVNKDSEQAWDTDKIQILKEAWQWRENLQRSIEGCITTDEVCAQNYHEYQELPGPNVPVPNGFQNLAEILSEDIDIRFQHIVKKIIWDHRQGQGQVKIICENGEKFEADAVIISVSLGVLKKNHEQMFNPQLPQWKINAIERLGFGVVDKIFVELPHEKETTGTWLAQNGEGKGIKDYRLLWKTDENFNEQLAKSTVKNRQNSNLNSNHVQNNNTPIQAPTTNLSLTPATSSESTPAPSPTPNDTLNSTNIVTVVTPTPTPNPISTPSNCTPNKCISTPTPSDCTRTPSDYTPTPTPGDYTPTPTPSDYTPTPSDYTPTWERGVYSWRYWGAEFQGSRIGGDKRPSAALWITGQEALDMEHKSIQEVSEGCINILKTFPAISRPQNNWQNNIRTYRSEWGTDPLFLGSYSFLKMGSKGDDLDQLFRPVNVDVQDSLGGVCEIPVLSFCGEATSRQYFGTAHGAYISGEKAASHLIEQFKKLSKF